MKIKRSTLIYGILILGIVCCLILIYVDLYERSRTHIHNYDEWSVVTAPTCTDGGMRERYCNCGDRQESAIVELGHDCVYVEEKPADCTHGGYEEYTKCSRCDFTTYEETEALGHDFGEWVEATAPSCTVDGVERSQCGVCLEFDERKIKATGHIPTDWQTESYASCMEDGIEYIQCSTCLTRLDERKSEATGHIPTDWQTESYASCMEDGIEYIQCSTCSIRLGERIQKATGHTPTDWLKERPASCTEDGLEYKQCSICLTQLEERVVEASGHTPTDWFTEKAANCMESGIEYKKCSVCLIRLVEHTTNATGHAFGEWKQISSPTCNSVGEEKRICANDENHTETRTIEKLSHKFSILSYDEHGHDSKCELCKTVVSQSHIWGDNDCTVCNYDAGGTKNIEYDTGGDGSYLIVKSIEKATSDSIVIPATYNGISVTAIGENTFSNFSGISISIPSSITVIVNGALKGCDNLQELKLPFIGFSRESPSNLGYLFGVEISENNKIPSSLKTIEISDGITRLQNEAFKNCTAITKVILPSTVEVLGAECFYGCTALKEIELPLELKIIESAAFWNCESLESIVIPQSVEEIGLGAFCGISKNTAITFHNTKDWFLYYNGATADVFKEEYFADTNTIISYNNVYTFKRKADGA